MELRRARLADVVFVGDLLRECIETMRAMQIPQWQEGYPNEESVQEDIAQGFGWVAVEADEILGYVALQTTVEKDYQKLLSGQWVRKSERYATLHRMATLEKAKRQGVAGFMVHALIRVAKEAGFSDLRIDTHRENQPMQAFIRKQQFHYCGQVKLLKDGTLRDVFQKVL